jgi:hypothetical protein
VFTYILGLGHAYPEVKEVYLDQFDEVVIGVHGNVHLQ